MDITIIIQQCREILGDSFVIIQAQDKSSFEKEWRNRYSNPCVAVLLPHTVAQIQQVVRFCNEHRIDLIPQGGNTSLCAGAIPTPNNRPQLILNLSKMNKVIEVDSESSSILLEAGCTLFQAQNAAILKKLYLPLSMGSEGSCQIGGNIATNAGGVQVIKYGMMRELVLGLEVVLADGSIVNQLCKLRKNNTNFDLKQMFIGSEGTLGIITKAILKLFPQPQAYLTGLIGVSSIHEAVILLNILKQRFSIVAFEIISQVCLDIYITYFPNHPLLIEESWVILFEFETDGKQEQIEILSFILVKHNLKNIIIATNEKERNDIWQIRENIPLAEKMNGFAVKHDISLPINQIEKFITINYTHIITEYPDAQIIIFGHLGDGNLHYNIQFIQRSYTQLQEIEFSVNSLVYDDVQAHGGSFSAEHGIGYIKKVWYLKYFDPISYSLAKTIKQTLDPNNILNPNKIFEDTK